MYEDMTFEAIMDRCLARVPDGIDKREGSIIYDAVAPAAAELAQAYINMGTLKDDVAFPDTASGLNLTKKASERGVIRIAASAAVRRGVFKNAAGAEMAVPIGTRYSAGDLNFTAAEEISPGNYKMICETPGAAGNQYFGSLIPIDFVENLGTAEIGEVLIPGEDEETDESLRKRYYDSLQGDSFGGNAKDYRNWANDLPGVGGTRVYPIWAGGGTVKLVIVSSEWGVPSAALVDEVQTAIDPETNQGKGEGIAPIGHTVTVQPVADVAVNITTELQFQGGYTWESVSTAVQAVIANYLTELIQSWEDVERIIVRISQIETRVLEVEGILDVTGTQINGAPSNLALNDNEIPILGTVTA